MRSAGIPQAPAFRLALLFVVGIVAANLFPLTPLWLRVMLVILVLCSALLAASRRYAGERSEMSLMLAVALCIAGGATKGIVDLQRDARLKENLETGQFFVVGQVTDPPTRVERRTRFTLEVEAIRRWDSWMQYSGSAAVTVVRSHRDSTNLQLDYGARVLLFGQLGPPPEARNPGEFSPRRYFQANGISLVFFARGHRTVVVLDSSGGTWWMREAVVPVRKMVLAEIDRTIGGEKGEFLKGLLIGERSGIPVTTRQAFVNAGVAHVLAVSGSNVAVVAMVLVLLLGLFRLPRWVCSIAVAAGLLFYMMLTGNQPPVVRATIMAVVVLLGRLLERKTNAYNVLGVSALVILAIDSRQLYDVGFQLSFGAVLSIVYLYPKLNAWVSIIDGRTRLRRIALWLIRLCAVSLAATVGTLPLTALSFGRISIIGILANMIVIPATSLSVVLGFVSSLCCVLSPFVGSVYAGVNDVVLQCTLAVTECSGGLPFAYIDTLRFRPVDAVPFYAFLSFCIYFGRPVIARKLFILLLIGLDLALLWPDGPAHVRTRGTLRVSIIDVGEGDAVLVEFPRGEIMLVDAGPLTGTYDAGEMVVVPFLRRRGITRVDLLVLTHPHSDHFGGAPSVIRHFDVKRVVDSGQPERSSLYSNYMGAVNASGAPRLTVKKGEMIDASSDVRVYVLSPIPELLVTDTLDQKANLNNTSVVLRIVYGSISLLLAGDAERLSEDWMTSSYGDFLCSTMLKAGHHGSSTSSSEQFLKCVRPSFVAISVGKNNKFHHPSASVLRRFGSMELEIMRTDDDGAIIVETDGVILTPIQWR